MYKATNPAGAIGCSSDRLRPIKGSLLQERWPMEEKRALLPLTSLRFVAAAMIVVHHGITVNEFTPSPLALDQGVSFFFVLSGFILTYSYPRLESWAEVRRFWIFR